MTTRPAAIAGSNRKATTARARKAEPKAPMSEREERQHNACVNRADE
jgi:hypothetical protein